MLNKISVTNKMTKIVINILRNSSKFKNSLYKKKNNRNLT